MTVIWRASLLLLILLTHCTPDYVVPKDAIIVLPEAVNVRSEPGFEGTSIEYELPDANFEHSLRAVAGQLSNRGWDDRTTITSYVNGWLCMPTEAGATFEWVSDWRHTDGHVVTYVFQTATDVRSSPFGHLTVKAVIKPDASPKASATDIAEGAPSLAVGVDCEMILKRAPERGEPGRQEDRQFSVARHRM